jgi:hypothetical protein
MHITHEYLRDGSALGTLHHLRQMLGRLFDVDFVGADPLLDNSLFALTQ